MNIEKEYVEGLLRKIERLQAERDMLLARTQTAERVEKIFSETPDLTFDDCLQLFAIEIRDVQAQAIDVFADCLVSEFQCGMSGGDVYGFAKKYSAKLRQGGAE